MPRDICTRLKRVFVLCEGQLDNKQYNVTTLVLLLSAGFMAGRVIMAMLAKFFIFISFDAVYVYAAELFPTVIRYGMIRG